MRLDTFSGGDSAAIRRINGNAEAKTIAGKTRAALAIRTILEELRYRKPVFAHERLPCIDGEDGRAVAPIHKNLRERCGGVGRNLDTNEAVGVAADFRAVEDGNGNGLLRPCGC